MMKRPNSQHGPSNGSNGQARNGHAPKSFASDRSFMVSAPGKVIVFGEHAVVHGKVITQLTIYDESELTYVQAAMAASVSLRSYLLVTPASASRPSVTLTFPDISLQHSWYLDELPFGDFTHTTKAKRFDEQVSVLDTELMAAIQPHVANVSVHLPEKARHQHHAAASCFLYILLSLGSPEMPSCVYSMRSTIPIGAGLGSSASISVCIAAALLIQGNHIQSPSVSSSLAQAEQTLDIINNWAFVGELCIHGSPSGVDNTVATKGKAVLFRRTKPGQPPQVTPLHDFPVLPLLLVDTKHPRSTAAEVAKVGALNTAHPEVVALILNAIDKITQDAHVLITNPNYKADDPVSLQRFGELIRMNHGLLVALSVSHPKLERVRELIDQANIGYTKLTGAGGGGCAITLLQPGATQDVLHELENRLEQEGFAKYETTLGGQGVGVLTSPPTDKGCVITNEEFLQVTGSQGIESLFRSEKAGQWRYWSERAA